MPKITFTSEEEILYLREIDQIQNMIPDIDVQIVTEPVSPYQGGYAVADTSVGDEFRSFLLSNKLKQSTSSEAA